MRRTKFVVKWEGPFPVYEKVSETTFMVNGHFDHAWNLKRGREEPLGIEDVSKRQRIRSLLALQPRGELLRI
jgi:hypothetical protein